MIRIHPNDNVAVATRDIDAGETVLVAGQEILCHEAVKAGHKIALEAIGKGEMLVKYGFPIGKATKNIEAGNWVHTHNMSTNLEGILEYQYSPENVAFENIDDGRTFDGFVRSNGDVGIRNEIWIIPTVGCVNKLAERLARNMSAELKDGSPIEGVFAFPHPYGCSQLGDDALRTQKTLAALVGHPNAGGVLVVSLGCENNNLDEFRPMLGEVDPQRVRFLVAQECEDEVEDGMQELRQLFEYASQFQRQPQPVSRLKVGLKCGSSDGFSGITANPLIGAFADRLVARGGSCILTEVPEMFGAETLLFNRCINQKVFDKSVCMINECKNYFLRHELPIYENPAPGNKKGGITTLEEKSLGCIQKGGGSPVVGVLDYGEGISTPGLNLLNGPGNDGISITGLTASGAQLILFSTGRGNPLGTSVPTVKISSNSTLAARKPHWIDFDAGQLLEGEELPKLTDELFETVLEIASGKEQTCNERNGYREISILRDGVTL